MKTKLHARDMRAEGRKKRKKYFSKDQDTPSEAIHGKNPEALSKAELKKIRRKEEEEGALEFLAYLEKEHIRPVKDEEPASVPGKKGKRHGIQAVNLEDGMPTVDEAVTRMKLALQEMKHSGFRTIKLIHGYGSSGKGGKICIGVRNELSAMKRKRLIRDYIIGEEFGPYHENSRNLAVQNKEIASDPDYGRMNHGITIVML